MSQANFTTIQVTRCARQLPEQTSRAVICYYTFVGIFKPKIHPIRVRIYQTIYMVNTLWSREGFYDRCSHIEITKSGFRIDTNGQTPRFSTSSISRPGNLGLLLCCYCICSFQLFQTPQGESLWGLPKITGPQSQHLGVYPKAQNLKSQSLSFAEKEINELSTFWQTLGFWKKREDIEENVCTVNWKILLQPDRKRPKQRNYSTKKAVGHIFEALEKMRRASGETKAYIFSSREVFSGK